MNFFMKQRMLLLVRALYFCMEDQWSELGKKHNITPAQQHILFLLSLNKSLTPSQISELGCWHISTVTRLLNPLKDKGLVIVSPDRNLRRYKNVFITNAGESLLLNVVNSVKETEHFPFPWNHLSENELIKFLEYGQSILDEIKGKSFGIKVINAKLEGVDYN